MSQITATLDGVGELALPPFSPFDPEVRTWPYPVYARYRSQDPVHWGAPAMPGLAGTWYLLKSPSVCQCQAGIRAGPIPE